MKFSSRIIVNFSIQTDTQFCVNIYLQHYSLHLQVNISIWYLSVRRHLHFCVGSQAPIKLSSKQECDKFNARLCWLKYRLSFSFILWYYFRHSRHINWNISQNVWIGCKPNKFGFKIHAHVIIGLYMEDSHQMITSR